MSRSARRYWPLWMGIVPLALWALVRAFGLEVPAPLRR
jgi:hypothetical protein